MGRSLFKQRHGDLFPEIAFGFQYYYQCNLEVWGSKGKLFTNRIFTAGNQIKPIVELETNDEKQLITLQEDKHFNNMLKHFHSVAIGKKNKEDEFVQNVNQARLINEIKIISNE